MKTSIFKKTFILCTIFSIIMPANIMFAHATKSPPTEIIKVGYIPNYGIINEPLVQGYEGYGYDYLDVIEQYSNYEFEYVEVEWEDSLDKLKSGEIDLFGPLCHTVERNKTLYFPEEPICYESVNLYAYEESSLYYKDTASLNGMTVGTIPDSVYTSYLKDYSRKNNIVLDSKHIDYNNAVESLKDGNIDLYLSGSMNKPKGVKIIDEIQSDPLYLVSTKENAHICKNIDKAIKAIEQENHYLNEIFWYKYFVDNQSSNESLTIKEAESLASNDVYSVGYHVDFVPLSYNDKNGLPRGYAIDVMNLIAERLNIKIKYVPLCSDQAVYLSNLDFSLSILEDDFTRHSQISKPYSIQDIIIFKDFDSADSDVKSILTYDFASLDENIFLRDYINATVHKADSSTDASNIFDTKHADCIATLRANSYMLLNTKYTEDTAITLHSARIPVGIYVSNNLPHEIYSAINKTITSISATEVEKLITENVNYTKKITKFEKFWIDNQLLILTSFTTALVLFVFIYWIIVRINNLKLKNLIEVDNITGLMTVSKFTIEAAKLVKKSNAPCRYYLISFDVDNFKSINQSYGTDKGSELLRSIANSMRKYSSKDTLLCRYHGDIFLILGKSLDDSEFNTDNILFSQEHCDEIMVNANINATLHFSTGIYIIDNADVSISYVANCVNKARTISKQSYGNIITFYTEELRQQTENETKIYDSMEDAIKNKEFFIVIQPKIELANGKLIGGEVLVRWKNSEGTYIYPDRFIPLFEKTSFIVTLDKYVFDLACQYVKNCPITPPRLSVNISPVTILSQNVIENYMNILASYELSPTQFELEITEATLDIEFDKIVEIVNQLRKNGFTLSIDDFGKGSSSLSRIKELDVDVIKLDKGFISNNLNAKKGNAVIANAISLASSLGITALAEGIETQEYLDLLIDLGCDLGQGYLFDKPLSLDEFTLKVTRENEKKE